VKITYDPGKRDRALIERGLDFELAIDVFEGLTFEIEDSRFKYPERRVLCIGHLEGRMVMIAYTPRGGTRRIISMRKCNAREVQR
jgi:uncharacterized DUF497 family protein